MYFVPLGIVALFQVTPLKSASRRSATIRRADGHAQAATRWIALRFPNQLTFATIGESPVMYLPLTKITKNFQPRKSYYRYIKRKQTKHKEYSTMNNPIMHYQLGKISSRELIRRRELEAAAAAYRRANTKATGFG